MDVTDPRLAATLTVSHTGRSLLLVKVVPRHVTLSNSMHPLVGGVLMYGRKTYVCIDSVFRPRMGAPTGLAYERKNYRVSRHEGDLFEEDDRLGMA
jgi:hypothetical protein